MTSAIDALAKGAFGIEPTFTDYFGKERAVSDETKFALMATMGTHVDSERAAQAELDRLRAGTGAFQMRPSTVLTQGASLSSLLDDVEDWEIVLETGDRFTGDTRELPLGYHRLRVRVKGSDAQCALIVTPQQCYVPQDAQPEDVWALATQLYALRSQRNWGAGDFTDLATLCALAGDAGAGAVALNPLHELQPSNPYACSPYSPSSRLFLNVAYIDVESVPDFGECEPARAMVASAAFQSRIAEVRARTLVDYAGVAAQKRPVLELLYASFVRWHLERLGDVRAGAFRGFVRRGGIALERLARYEALAEYFRERDGSSYGWLQWPGDYRSPSSAAVERFARERRARVDFYLYLQWLAELQLAAAAVTARAHGAGLYRDLAVGVELNGADAWADQETIAGGASLGAPPDHLNAHGQNWGLPPYSPPGLGRDGYAPFAALLRANMRHSKILRIDHVMSLRRAFWIPRGATPLDGAYVDYPFADLTGIMALESVRNRCVVVGEDLGTLPDGFRTTMARRRALSSRLIYFERSLADGRFHAPATYPHLAASSVGTHDLPPLLGWWIADDIALRDRIGLFPTPQSLREAGEDRRHARFTLVDALVAAAAIDEAGARALRDDADRNGTVAVADALSEAVHRFLASTPSLVKVVAIEDVLGEIDAVNVPGTTVQHPNWQRKRSLTLEALADDGRLARIGRIMKDTPRAALKEATL